MGTEGGGNEYTISQGRYRDVCPCPDRAQGYEIVQSIAYYTEINEGTVYPILRRLTQEEYFVTYLKESTVGPARKYYHMTEKGKGYLGSLKADWDDFSKMVNEILRGEVVE